MEHALFCFKVHFPLYAYGHNDIRDFTAKLLTEACHDVIIEPTLQLMTTEVSSGASANSQDGARLNIIANGFWDGRHERSYFEFESLIPWLLSTLIQPIRCFSST